MFEVKPGRRPFVPFHVRTLTTLVRTGSYEKTAQLHDFPDCMGEDRTGWVACCVTKAMRDLVPDDPMREPLRLIYRERLINKARAGLAPDDPMHQKIDKFYEERPR